MRILVNQASEHANNHVRGGNKRHRGLEVARINQFLEWVEDNERIRHIDRLGGPQVIRFWKAHQHLSDRTRHRYWLALCLLWEWFRKTGTPPRPYEQNERSKYREDEIKTKLDNLPTFQDMGTAISYAIAVNGWTTKSLANMTGVEAGNISALISNRDDVALSLSGLNALLSAAGLCIKPIERD